MIGAHPVLTLGLAAAIIASTLQAQDFAFIGQPGYVGATVVTIDHTDHPGAVAVVNYQNAQINHQRHNGNYSLSLGPMVVTVRFTWTAGSDEILVIPPPGFIAVPDVLVVAEDGSASALIFPDGWSGM